MVLMQMEVGEKTNEITVAPQVVQTLDLRGVVVTGDAMQAQRADCRSPRRLSVDG